MLRRAVHGLLCCSLVCAALAGCRGPAGPRLVPVHGQVKYRHRPLGGATLCFVPDITRGNRNGLQATAQSAADGSFTLQTYPHGDGVMAGFYKVTCIVFGGVALPHKYRNPSLTPLVVEVTESGTDPLLLDLTD